MAVNITEDHFQVKLNSLSDEELFSLYKELQLKEALVKRVLNQRKRFRIRHPSVSKETK